MGQVFGRRHHSGCRWECQELFSVKPNQNLLWNLAVIFDKRFIFHAHILTVCSSCFYHIRDLQHIRRHLDLENAILFATALVSSRLDYCNSHFIVCQTLTSPNFNVFRIDWSRSTKVTSFHSQCSTALLASLVASKI